MEEQPLNSAATAQDGKPRANSEAAIPSGVTPLSRNLPLPLNWSAMNF